MLIVGSVGKRSGTPAAEYLRWSEGPGSPTSAGMHGLDLPHGNRSAEGDDEDLDFETNEMLSDQEGFEGLENVWTCCDGRHTVGRAHDHVHTHDHQIHHTHTRDIDVSRHRRRQGMRAVDALQRMVDPNRWSSNMANSVMALAALGSSLLATLFLYPSRDPDRLPDLMHFFRFIASSTLLGVNYSALYRSFASNFSWAIGLFGSTSSSPIQTAINHMQHDTCGDMIDITGNGVDLVDRHLSPYSVGAVVTGGSSETLAAVQNLQQKNAVNAANSTTSNAIRAFLKRDNTATVRDSNVLNVGIPFYAGSLGMALRLPIDRLLHASCSHRD